MLISFLGYMSRLTWDFIFYVLQPSHNLFVTALSRHWFYQNKAWTRSQLHVHVCIFYFHSLRSYKCDAYEFYEHVDKRTCISSLSYIKLERLDNDIKTKGISKTCTNHETKGKPRINSTSRYWTCITKLSVHERNSPTPNPLSHRAIGIPECYNLYSTSESEKFVASKQRRERNFVKLQKYAFLKQNNSMRIDESPYLSSLFYKSNFVSIRQFFINRAVSLIVYYHLTLFEKTDFEVFGVLILYFYTHIIFVPFTW